MPLESLPEESESQKIGQLAKLAFERSHPVGWRPIYTEGDSDVGLDAEIQVVDKNVYVGLFHAQLKGSKQDLKGASKILSADKKYYSIPLKIKTLNYYARIESPVMLIFADLTQDDDPRKCNTYYLWIDDEIEKLKGNNRNLDHLNKKRHTFHIPVTNLLDSTFDATGYLNERLEKKKVLQDLFKSIDDRHEEPLNAISEIGNRIESKSIILDSVLETTENPWIDAPKDSFAYSLHKISDYKELNNLKLVAEELEKSNEKFNEASNHEKSEYLFQKAWVKNFQGNNNAAEKLYKEAHILSPEVSKYHIAYIESRIPKENINDKHCDLLLNEIKNKNDEAYNRLKSKLYALKGKHKKALNILKGQNEKDISVLKPLIFLLGSQFEDAIVAADLSLKRNDISQKAKFNLRAIKARALFSIGIEKVNIDKENRIIPFAGLPGMNPNLLRKAFSEILKSWETANQIGYPPEAEYIVDMSAILGMYFDDYHTIFEHLKAFANKYKGLMSIQEALLQIAFQQNDKRIIKKQLSIVPDSAEMIINKIILYYKEDKKNKVIETVLKNLEMLINDKPKNLNLVLAIAAQCANDLIRNEARDKFIATLKTLPDYKICLSIYEFFSELINRPLSKSSAIEKLYMVYKTGQFNDELLTQLFVHLDPNESDSAKKIIEVAKDIRSRRGFFEKEYHKICKAKSTLNDWEGVLKELDEAIQRYGERPRLLAIKALALDEIGDTPGSIQILSQVVEMEDFDPFAFELYANIASRSGLIGKAKQLVIEIFEKASDKKQKLSLLRMLYSLEMHLDPESKNLLNIVDSYGSLNNRDDEHEEGIYLILFFGATISLETKVTEKQSSEFKKRLENYIVKFPDSKILKAVQWSEDSPREEILEQIRAITGMTDEKRKWYIRNENSLKYDKWPVPFSIRPKILLNVSDLMHLWEISKKVDIQARQYHFNIDVKMYDYRKIEEFENSIPLIDELSILVLYDLDLLEFVFNVFGKVAITKTAISHIQNWGQEFFISPYSTKAKNIGKILANYIDQIYQPSIEFEKTQNNLFSDLDELHEIFVQNNYIFLSDDIITRIYICDDNHKSLSLTTLDIINVLRDRNYISEKIAVEKIAQLCSWKIGNIKVHFIDILKVIKEDFDKNEKIQAILDKLDQHKYFIFFIDYIWSIDKRYENLLSEIGNFISMMVNPKDGLFVDSNIIIAIWFKWFQKVQFVFRGEQNKLSFLARSFVSASIFLSRAAAVEESVGESYNKIWGMYINLVSFTYGNSMTQKIESEARLLVAEMTARFVNKHDNINLFSLILSGLVNGTSESDSFKNHYTKTLITLKREDKG